MADRKISDLTALTTPASGDYLPIVDISESAAASKNKRITVEELMRGAPDGTAAAPSIAFESDPNTGIYSPGADQLAISTNGTGRLVVDASGNINLTWGVPRLATIFDNGYRQGLAFDSSNRQLRVFSTTSDSGGSIGFYTRNGAGASDTDYGTERVRIDSSGLVGIGTSSPIQQLHVVASAAQALFEGATQGSITIQKASTLGMSIYSDGAGRLAFYDNAAGSERLRIDSSGRLLVGTSTGTNNIRLEQKLAIVHAANGAFPGAQFTGYCGTTPAATPLLEFCRSRGATDGTMTKVESGDRIGLIQFRGTDGSTFQDMATIDCYADGATSSNDVPGRLVFSTTADGASSPTERMRISSDGLITIENAITAASKNLLNVEHKSNTFGSDSKNIFASSYAAASNTWLFFAANSDQDGSPDREFGLYGDGNGKCDGSWTGGGADYAEYFEWSDGNPDTDDRRGISVVLDGEKIRPAIDGEDPIGVISGNPSVVGDAAWNKWSGKYLRDEYGTYIQEDYEVEDEDGKTIIQQRRKLNPAYDPDVEYVSREQRPEWDCVGLMGKLRIRKGQPTGSRWIKMRDVSNSVEEWLVR